MDWLNGNVWLFWIGVALVLAAIEAATVDFVFIMFAGGALAAAVAAGLGASFPVQVVVAVGVAVLLLFSVRPLIKLGGETWSARLAAGTTTTVGPGEAVRVIAIHGATAIVSPVPPTDQTPSTDPTTTSDPTT